MVLCSIFHTSTTHMTNLFRAFALLDLAKIIAALSVFAKSELLRDEMNAIELSSGRYCGFVAIYSHNSSKSSWDHVIKETFIGESRFNIRLTTLENNTAIQMKNTLSGFSTCVISLSDTVLEDQNHINIISEIFSGLTHKHVLIMTTDTPHHPNTFNLQQKGLLVTMIGVKDYAVRKIGCPFKRQQLLSTEIIKARTLKDKYYSQCAQKSLFNRNITISYLGLPPYIVYGNEPGTVSGSDIDLIKILSSHFGFSYSLLRESFWARQNPHTKHWEGSIGSVLNGTSLLGIGVHMTTGYYKMVDYAALLHSYDVRYCAVKPRKILPYLNLVRPLEDQVWVYISLTFFISAPIFVYITRRENSKCKITATVLNLWGSYYNQSVKLGKYHHSNVPSIIFICSWLGYVFFTLATYEGNLRAFLIQDHYEQPIDSDYDMVSKGKKLFLPLGSFYPNFFKYSPNPLQRQISEVMEKEGNFFKVVKGLVDEEVEKRVVRERHAFIWTTDTSRASFPLIERRHGWQPFRLSKQIIFQTYNGWVIAKRQPLRNEVNHAVQRLTDSGIKSYLVRKYIHPKYLHPEKEKMQPDVVEIGHIIASIVTLVIGATLACLTFVMECKSKLEFWRKWKSLKTHFKTGRDSKTSRVIDYVVVCDDDIRCPKNVCHKYSPGPLDF